MKPDVALERINVSVGTAGLLGLADVPMAVAPTTAYLMLGGRCAMNCAFCAQARGSEADVLKLSRVTWPEYPLEVVVHALGDVASNGAVKRACIQVTVGEEAFQKTLVAVHAIKSSAPELPLDVAILPMNMEQVRELLAAGVDHIGIGLDAASRPVFERVKGNRWRKVLALLEEAAREYPGRVAVHLIVGLGETEKDVIALIQHLHDLSVTVGLFAFTPVAGTAMDGWAPPDLSSYRRVQAARYLIVHGGCRAEQFNFSADGRLLSFGVRDVESLLSDGEAFRTSGCPDCNRPYYNERPGGVMYNYPCPLTPEQAQKAVAELELEGRQNLT